MGLHNFIQIRFCNKKVRNIKLFTYLFFKLKYQDLDIRLDPSASVEKKTSHLIDTSKVARRAISKGESKEYCSVAGHDISGNTTHSLPPLFRGERDSGRRFPGIHIQNSSVIPDPLLSAFQGEGSHS